MLRGVFRWVQPALQTVFLLFALVSFAFAQVGQFVENQTALPTGAGCGDVACNEALGQGRCDTVNQWCICTAGWGGLECEVPSSQVWCPENCNGVGLCRPTLEDPSVTRCHCYSGFYGASCHGELYAYGWKSWAHLVGWIFSFASLVPIPLMLLSSTIRRSLKRRLDVSREVKIRFRSDYGAGSRLPFMIRTSSKFKEPTQVDFWDSWLRKAATKLTEKLTKWHRRRCHAYGPLTLRPTNKTTRLARSTLKSRRNTTHQLIQPIGACTKSCTYVGSCQ